ncbi:mitochondrial carrier [Jaminaea rosea]|uniref:Mitochondrial carrier n=1 Tax=Jaminaea rosea TaxID=1569628 RepID=A0A316UTN4_9BASI|nr:mitochondrial carrier [Jaminaea rosea]PWN28656.1 mitochondrial carrier [Jaminaea rosea]
MSSPSSSSAGFVPTFTMGDYGRFLAAGGLCATITHGAMTPFDVVKTNLQFLPKGSPDASMLRMTRKIIATDGTAGLFRGFAPTAMGYLIQGGAKYAGFEAFKRQFALAAGSKEEAQKHRLAIYFTAAAAAEFIATTLLTPLEAARIRLVSSKDYANGLVGALGRMTSEGGVGQLYAGYAPILCKQIPFSIAQFAVNESLHEFVNTNQTLRKLSKDGGKAGEVSVQLGCGMGAGAAAAVVSHPADFLLSKINQGNGGKGGSAMSKLLTLAGEAGIFGVWQGLGARVIMTAGLISAQFAIYGQIKSALGAPNGVDIAKADGDAEKSG